MAADLLCGLLLDLLVVGAEHGVDGVHLEDAVLDHQRRLLEEVIGHGGRATLSSPSPSTAVRRRCGLAHVILVLEPQQLDEGIPVERKKMVDNLEKFKEFLLAMATN